MIARLRAFGRFWYDFVIGDDWRVALVVVAALALTYVLSRLTTAPVWWLVPAALVLLLPLSLLRGAGASAVGSRDAGRDGDEPGTAIEPADVA